MNLFNNDNNDNIWSSHVKGKTQTVTEYSSNLNDEHSENFSYTWTIENISHYFAEDYYYRRDTIYSEYFPRNTFQDDYSNQLAVKFYLELVPDGEDENCENFVSVFLYLPSCIKSDVVLDYKFWIINADEKKCNYEENRRHFSRGEGWGWREFILREELLDLDNGYITEDDSLTIYCEVTVIHEDIVKPLKTAKSTERQRNSIISVMPRSKSIGKLEFAGLNFDGSMFDAIDGKPIVIEDGKVDEMKSLWEYRKGKY